MWSTVALLAMVMEQSTTQPDYSAAIALHAGRGTPLTRCEGDILRVREWRLCLPMLQAHLDAGTCLAYVFGVDTNSPIADVLVSRGCTVHAFDPSRDCSDPVMAKRSCYHRSGECYESIERAPGTGGAHTPVKHPTTGACHKRAGLNPKVHFRHWGLLSGSQNETAFHSQAKYEALTGEFHALDTIVARLGHGSRARLALLALDCEGCEWDVFARLANEQSAGAIGLQRFEQLVVELHFSQTLRFTLDHAAHDVPTFNRIVAQSGFVPFASRSSPGYGQDRTFDEALVRAGLEGTHCCIEISMMQRGGSVAAAASGGTTRTLAAPPMQSSVGGGTAVGRDALPSRSEYAAHEAHAPPRSRGQRAPGLISDFFEHQGRHLPAGFEAPLRRWRSMITRSQAPPTCVNHPLCQCVHVRGAFFSNVRGIAVCVMAAALRGCAAIRPTSDLTARPYSALGHMCPDAQSPW